ncbi:MAG: hypothetical protein ACQKBW_09925, partial [Puniceicoccales bacterium]
MKLLKWLLILLSVVVVLVVAGVLFVLNSASFQKSIVLGALEKQAEVPEFGYFKAGLSDVTIRSLAVEKDGMVVGLDELTLKYSFWDFLLNKEARVDDLAVSGLVVNMRGPSVPMGPGPVIPQKSSPSEVSPQPLSEKTSGKAEHESFEPEPFKGLFTHGVLPFKLYVGKVDVEAQVLLPGRQNVKATLSGGGIEPGASGQLVLAVNFEDGAEQAQLSQGKLDATLTLTQDEDAAITRVQLAATVKGDSAVVADAPTLAFNADLAQQTDKTET